jgi:hypothetical protein
MQPVNSYRKGNKMSNDHLDQTQSYLKAIHEATASLMEVAGGLRPLEEAKPLSPVAQQAPIHPVVNGPAYGVPRPEQAGVAGGVDCHLVGGHDDA